MNQATAQDSPLARLAQASPLSRQVGCRLYGVPMDWERRAEQAFPQFCVSIYDEMFEASTLLKLAEGADHEAIYAAYAIDLKFLKGRLADIVKMIDNAVRFSKARRTFDNQLDEGAEWQAIRGSIPGFGSVSMLNMTADMAAQEQTKFLADMKAIYHSGVEQLLHRMCLWLDTLTGYEFVGQVELTSPTTGRYYYYRRSVVKQEIGKEEFVEVADNPFDPFSTRQVLLKTERTYWRENHDVELHEHHIVQASRQAISDFEHPMPERVRNFLEQTAPWLLRHMGILSGTMTLEKVIKRTARSDEGHVENVSVFDPAVTLGNYALVGWTENDMSDGGVRSRIQKNYERARRSNLWRIARASSLVLVCVVTLGFFARHLVIESNAEDVAKYQSFIQAFNGAPRHTIKKDELVMLPGGQPLAYFGILKGGLPRIVLASSLEKAYDAKNRDAFNLMYGAGMRYGTVDLRTGLGIPATIQVIDATDESITFVVDQPLVPRFHH